MRDFFSRHARVALLFSGGRDSLACLMLCREYWPQITVVWGNPGNPYAETVEQMARVRAMVPHFVEVKGRQPEFVRERGYPLDVVPMSMTPFGRVVGRSDGVRVVPYTECCETNLWNPTAAHLAEAGYTGVIRGDKASDSLKPPLSTGDVHGGVEFLFPIEKWSNADVLAFVGDELPPSYRRGVHTSLDCLNCTAYLSHNAERIADLRVVAPRVHEEVSSVLGAVAAEIGNHIELLEKTGVSS